MLLSLGFDNHLLFLFNANKVNCELTLFYSRISALSSGYSDIRMIIIISQYSILFPFVNCLINRRNDDQTDRSQKKTSQTK